MSKNSFLAFIFVYFLFSIYISVNALCVDYYDQTCPKAESIVKKNVRNAILNDETVPAGLLRAHFHDCFIRGCDASVLLNSTENNEAEKDGSANFFLHALNVIDNAKREIEDTCPGVVSCADILALAARDAVAFYGGPYWDVPKGRLDGRVSLANETGELPGPISNITQLLDNFYWRGLNLEDLVALSGGHTLGFAHCSSFQNRLFNFDENHDVDPTLDPKFAKDLRKRCPLNNTNPNAGIILDVSPTKFDNNYYNLLLQGQAVFTSDQALLTSSRATDLVRKFANSQDEFFNAFVKSMIKMSSNNYGGEEIRSNCRVVNNYDY